MRLCLISCAALHFLVLLAADVVLVPYVHVHNALMSQSQRNPMGTSCSSGFECVLCLGSCIKGPHLVTPDSLLPSCVSVMTYLHS